MVVQLIFIICKAIIELKMSETVGLKGIQGRLGSSTNHGRVKDKTCNICKYLDRKGLTKGLKD